MEIPIPGEHNVLNALAGACVGMELGLDVKEICAGIKKAQTIGGRTNLIHANDMLIIDDVTMPTRCPCGHPSTY